MNARPRPITMTPRMRVIGCWYRMSTSPKAPKSNPYATNTALNPRTNSSDPSRTLLLVFVGAATVATADVGDAGGADTSPASSAPVNPVTNDRYPGTSGRTHGLKNETAPAAKAIGAAKISEPDITVSAALMGSTGLLAHDRLDHAQEPGRIHRP